jgi:hypothetical protein
MAPDPQLKLRALHEAAERVSANLVELELDSSRRLLEASELRGDSAERWSAAGAALTELWRLHGLLEALLEQADKLRGTRRTDELRSLLDGASIELASAELPLAQRSLLSDPTTAERCSPEELLKGMSSAFDDVKVVISSIGSAWETFIPRLDQARRALQECIRLDSELNGAFRVDLGVVQARLDRVGEGVTHDPLSVQPGDIDELMRTLRKTETDLEATVALTRGFDARMLSARELLERLRTAVDQACAAHDEMLVKISLPAPTPAHHAPDGLTSELPTIAGLAERGAWREARHALEEWTAQAHSALEETQRTLEANRAPLEQRDQFRALLDAYRIKAKRLGRLEDAELEDIFARAHEALYTAPTDLAAAAQLVRRYQQALSGIQQVGP